MTGVALRRTVTGHFYKIAVIRQLDRNISRFLNTRRQGIVAISRLTSLEAVITTGTIRDLHDSVTGLTSRPAASVSEVRAEVWNPAGTDIVGPPVQLASAHFPERPALLEVSEDGIGLACFE